MLARLGAALGPLCVIGLPLFNHLALASGRWLAIAAVLTMVQVLVVAVLLLRRSSGAGRLLIVAGLVLLVVARSWSARAGLAMGAGLSHAALYLALLTYFARSLRPGHVDVASGMALRIRRTLRPDMLAYTRNVTRAWCMFFCGQLLGSALLWLTAPLTVWSFFINVLDLPLVVAMFVGEYAVRLIRFRHDDHAGFMEMVRAWRVQPSASGEA